MTIERLKQFNQRFIAHDLDGEVENERCFELIERGSKIILSAPHATRTFRNHKVKAADFFTGPLTMLAGEQSNLTTLVRTRFVEEPVKIEDYVVEHKLDHHFFIDIHAMKDQPFALAVGTGIMTALEYQPELEFIKELAAKYDISMVINHPDYRGGYGLTGFLQQRSGKPQVLQLEWRKDLRDFYNYPQEVERKTLPFLRELVEQLAMCPDVIIMSKR